MQRWDEYRARRDVVYQSLHKVQKKRDAVRSWIVLQSLMARIKAIGHHLTDHRELKAKLLKEEAARLKREQAERLAAEATSENQGETAPAQEVPDEGQHQSSHLVTHEDGAPSTDRVGVTLEVLSNTDETQGASTQRAKESA